MCVGSLPAFEEHEAESCSFSLPIPTRLSSSPPQLCRATSSQTNMTSTDVLVTIWEDLEPYLSYLDLAELSQVSRRFKALTVLGGGPENCEATSIEPSHRSFHRFR